MCRQLPLFADRRGGSLLEYMILLGCIAFVALAGYRAFGQAASDKVTEQAECVQSLACGEGSPGPDAPESGAVPSRDEQIDVAAQTAATTKQKWEPVAGGQRLVDVFLGIVVDGAWDTVTSIYEAVTDLPGTWEGIKYAVSHPIETLGAIKDSIVEAWEENPDRVAGQGIFEVGTFFLAPLKIAKVAKLRYLAKASKATKIASEAGDTAGDLAKTGGKASDVAKAAGKADEIADLDRTFGKAEPPAYAKDFEKGPDGMVIKNPTRQTLEPGVKPDLTPGEEYIWVIDKDGKMIIGKEVELEGIKQPDGRPAKLGHPTLTDNEPARIGGELRYDAATGKWKMNNLSGRYTRGHADRGQDQLDAAAEKARQSGLDVVPDFKQLN